MTAATTLPDLSRTKVLRLARKKWGERVTLHDAGSRRGDSSPERRARALAAKNALVKPVFKPLAEWPAETPLGEYREALAAHHQARKKYDADEGALWSEVVYSRFEIRVVIGGLFTETKGQGDTWREAAIKAGLLSDDDEA